MGGPSFRQLAMQIVEPLLQDGLIAGYDFIFDDADDEQEQVEIPFDSNSGSYGVAEPITQSQLSMNQFQFQSQSSKNVGQYSSLNLEAMYMSTFLGFGIVDGGKIPGLTRENELQVGQQFCDKEAVLFTIKSYSI